MRLKVENDQVFIYKLEYNHGGIGGGYDEEVFVGSFKVSSLLTLLEEAGYIAKYTRVDELQPNSIQEQSDISKRVRDIIRARSSELENGITRMLKDWYNQG